MLIKEFWWSSSFEGQNLYKIDNGQVINIFLHFQSKKEKNHENRWITKI